MNGPLLEERPLGDRPVREQVLVVADAAVLEARGVRGQRIGQPDLVDDPHVEADVHAEHAQVGEEHGVRAGVLRRRRPAAVGGGGGMAGTTSHWS